MTLTELRLVLILQGGCRCLGENSKTQKKTNHTDPYVIPAMVHFLKCMTLQVKVPVLSEKRYFTWEVKIRKKRMFYWTHSCIHF